LSSTLLHLTDFADWEMWFQLSGLPTEAAQTGIRFSDMNLVYAAALGAQGVAMGDEFICQQAMATGLLIRPFDLAIRSPRSYFMIVPPEKADNPASAAFRGWLRAELPQD
jgi:LysR family glycine cleavage system transcriptional activator